MIKIVFHTFLVFMLTLYVGCNAELPDEDVTEEQIEQFLREHMEILDRLDLEAYMNNFSEDATWQNAVGMHLEGKSDIEEFLARIFPTLENAGWEVHNIIIQLVTPEVAVADVEVDLRNQILPEGFIEGMDETVIPERNLLNTYILKRDNGEWSIAAEKIRDKLDLDALVD